MYSILYYSFSVFRREHKIDISVLEQVYIWANEGLFKYLFFELRNSNIRLTLKQKNMRIYTHIEYLFFIYKSIFSKYTPIIYNNICMRHAYINMLYYIDIIYHQSLWKHSLIAIFAHVDICFSSAPSEALKKYIYIQKIYTDISQWYMTFLFSSLDISCSDFTILTYHYSVFFSGTQTIGLVARVCILSNAGDLTLKPLSRTFIRDRGR